MGLQRECLYKCLTAEKLQEILLILEHDFHDLGRRVAKLVARLLATAALWVRIEIQNGRHKQSRG